MQAKMKTLFCENQGAAHAVLSPSSAHRWLFCHAAPMMETGFPDDAGEYAAEGTAAHDAAALALITGKPVQARENIDEELVPFVQEYVDLVNRMASGDKKYLFIEASLNIASVTGEYDAHGTADAVIFSEKEIVIVDLKFGRGVKVEAKENPQLLIYGLAAEAEFGGNRKIRLVIFQPRLHHLSEWTPSSVELDVFKKNARVSGRTALAIYRGEAPRRDDYFPSEETCRFCRARGRCGALEKKVQEEVGADFDALADMDGDKDAVSEFVKNSGVDISRAYAAVPVIEAWCRAVSAEAERILHAGEDLPGFKLVAGRKGARYWNDADAAADALRALQFGDADIFERKLISPAQAEKMFKASGMAADYWHPINAMISQNDAKPVIVPCSDKRPALSTAVKDDFAELD